MTLTIDQIRGARERLAPHLEITPLLSSQTLSERAGIGLLLKAENLQRTGSFKVRGAFNSISMLGGSEACPGVICASAGNHAQGVALAAKLAGITATIVMPVDTPIIKVDKTRSYGAHVLLWGESYEEAYQRALDIGRERGYAFVHPFEDEEVMAGQGTIGLELLDQAPELAAVVVPVGGGGLVSGIATAIKETRPEVKIYGVQAAGAAPVAASFEANQPVELESAETIADAIRFKKCSAVTLPIMQRYLEGVVAVGEDEIAEAVARLLEDARLVVEGAGAVPLAAFLSGKIPDPGGPVALVLSGGNIDLNIIARVIEQGLSRASRYLVVRTQVPDKPGRLHKLLSHFASKRVNVIDVEHRRAGWRIPLGMVEIELLLETRSESHVREILRDLQKSGYQIERGETLTAGSESSERPGQSRAKDRPGST